MSFFFPVIVRGIKRWVAPTLRELQRRKLKAVPEKIVPRSDYLEWNYDAEIYAFGKRLGEKFEQNILRRALTHKSYVVKEQLQAEKTGLLRLFVFVVVFLFCGFFLVFCFCSCFCIYLFILFFLFRRSPTKSKRQYRNDLSWKRNYYGLLR